MFSPLSFSFHRASAQPKPLSFAFRRASTQTVIDRLNLKKTMPKQHKKITDYSYWDHVSLLPHTPMKTRYPYPPI